MSEIFVDNDCSVCSSYGEYLNKRNSNVKVSNQLNLNQEDIERDELVYINNTNKFYASGAVIECIADIGGLYQLIKILYLKTLKRYVLGSFFCHFYNHKSIY